MKAFKLAKESISVIWKNKPAVLLGMFIELLFVVSLGLTFGFFISIIENNLIYLGDEIVTNGDIGQIFNIILSSNHFLWIVAFAAILAAIIYILYTFMQGFVWKLCFSLGEKKVNYWNYIKGFAKLNILWFVIAIMIFILNFVVSYIEIVTESGKLFSTLTYILFFLLFYLAIISYAILDKKKAWESIKRSFRLAIRIETFLMYVFIIVCFTIADQIVRFLEVLPNFLTLVLSILIVLPLMIWSRIFVKRVVDSL